MFQDWARPSRVLLDVHPTITFSARDPQDALKSACSKIGLVTVIWTSRELELPTIITPVFVIV
jgi:hypothetical protein